jgi:hypothetical protein
VQARPRRTKFVEPPWPQANQGQAWPTFTVSEAGFRRQWATMPARFKPRRLVSAEPNWPQVLGAAAGGHATRAVDVLPLIPKQIG